MRRAFLALLSAGILLPTIAQCQIANIVVTNAASFQPGMPANASIGTLFCTGLNIQGVVSAENLPLPFSLAGVTVTINGYPAPLFAVANLGGYQQINFQVPLEGGVSGLAVVTQSGVQGSVMFPVNPNIAGDFFRVGSTQFGIFQHSADWSLVTPDNPATAGETIIGYATGLPVPTPSVPAGQPALASPLSYVSQVSSASIINTMALVINGPSPQTAIYLQDAVPPSGNTTGELPIPFMGLAPGAVGLFQINFVFPQGVPSGNARIQLVRSTCTAHFIATCSGTAYDTDQTFSQPVLIPVR